MKTVLLFILLAAFTTPLCAEDKITLKTGKTVTAQVDEISEDSLRYSIQNQFGKSSTSIPLASVKKVQFSNADAIAELASTTEPASVSDLAKAWQTWKSHLPVPGSTIGNLGLLLAQRYLDQGTEDDINKAKNLADIISAGDSNVQRRAQAKELILEINIARGMVEDVVAEAKKGLTSEDPATRNSSSYLLALATIEDYKQLIEENPRWQRDPEVRDERNALYHQIFDLLLISYLGNEASANVAARSAWAMSDFYLSEGNLAKALSTATDIVTIYPETKYSPLAQKRLQENQQQNTP